MYNIWGPSRFNLITPNVYGFKFHASIRLRLVSLKSSHGGYKYVGKIKAKISGVKGNVINFTRS